MGLAAVEVIYVVVIDGQPRLGRRPLGQPLAADGQQFRLDVGQRAHQPPQDAHAAANAGRGRLVGRLHSLAQIGVDEGLLGPLHQLVAVAQGLEQRARAFAQAALPRRQPVDVAGQGFQLGRPLVGGGEDAAVVPGAAGVYFVACGNMGQSHRLPPLVGDRGMLTHAGRCANWEGGGCQQAVVSCQLSVVSCQRSAVGGRRSAPAAASAAAACHWPSPAATCPRRPGRPATCCPNRAAPARRRPASRRCSGRR